MRDAAVSDTLPRSQQSAWQRWELASLGAESEPRLDPATAARLEAERQAAELAAAVRAEAHAQGYAAGLAAARDAHERLAALLATLGDHAARHEQKLADEVLDLALALARQLVGGALEVRRELILPIVAAALRQLPQSTQRVQLRVHPSDLALIRERLPAEPDGPRVTLVGDPAIAAGGCQIDTDHASLDATLPTRLQRLLAGLGRADDWLVAL
jgi:flagellar assembly protein FliH